jgi:NhaP-type Na+/H+ or K+/H+ antiporter
MEGAFFVRTFFFLLLGFSTDLIDFASSTAWVVTGAIVVLIYATRWPLLRALCPADSAALLWIAPRGLITVVLFLNLPEPLRIAHFPTGTVMLVVLTTAVLLGAGIRANASSTSVPAEGAQGTADP